MNFVTIGSGQAARGVPVFLPTTEALADANTFVCEMTGGAAANETGAGGGLAGADLVLTQVGSVPAAVGGLRQLNGSSQYFTWTAAALVAMLGGAEWTVMHHFNTFAALANAYICRLISGTANNGTLYELIVSATKDAGAQVSNTRTQSMLAAWDAVPGTGDVFFAAWKKGPNTHFGFSTTGWPTGWDSLDVDKRVMLPRYGDFSTGNFATQKDIIGSTSGYPNAKVGTLVVSKIGLQAAPV